MQILENSYSVEFEGFVKSKQKMNLYIQPIFGGGKASTFQLKPFESTLGEIEEFKEGEYKYKGRADFQLTEKGWQMTSCNMEIPLLPGISQNCSCMK